MNVPLLLARAERALVVSPDVDPAVQAGLLDCVLPYFCFPDDAEEQANQAREYYEGLNRLLRTRGLKINRSTFNDCVRALRMADQSELAEWLRDDSELSEYVWS